MHAEVQLQHIAFAAGGHATLLQLLNAGSHALSDCMLFQHLSRGHTFGTIPEAAASAES